jgi:hypothetical protein
MIEKFSKDKETKNTIRYKNDKDESAVTYIYIRTAEAKKLGDRISIKIEKAK